MLINNKKQIKHLVKLKKNFSLKFILYRKWKEQVWDHAIFVAWYFGICWFPSVVLLETYPAFNIEMDKQMGIEIRIPGGSRTYGLRRISTICHYHFQSINFIKKYLRKLFYQFVYEPKFNQTLFLIKYFIYNISFIKFYWIFSMKWNLSKFFN